MSHRLARTGAAGLLLAAVTVLATLTLTAATCVPPTTTTETTMGTIPTMRAVPDPIYGVTLDSVGGASQATLNPIKTALTALATSHLPMARLVLDEGEPPSQYTLAVDQLKPIAYLMGEILDSESLASITTAAYLQRTKDYLAAFGDKIDLWEVGNEIGGAWAGPYDGAQGQVAKIAAAYDEVKSRNKKTALTLWHNIGCEDSGELQPLQFIQQKLPARMKTGLNYLFLSYYEVPCNNNRASVATWKAYYEAIRVEMPNTKLGFGEIGLENKVTAGTLANAQSIANYYYGLSAAMALPSWYTGAYFWWYFQQDGVPSTKPMHTTIKNKMATY